MLDIFKKKAGRKIVALSGGKASAYCAHWALKKFKKEDVVLYFNDTKWEHKDLYRFLDDLSAYLKHPITRDSDGRNPEQLFKDNRALANNRMPFCSRILKAERLQKFFNDGDDLVFGIGRDEIHRATRIVYAYQRVSVKLNKFPSRIHFPLIEDNISKEDIDSFLFGAGIEEPELYKLGFLHNNCSGGCVRAGKKQWKMLYEKMPDVYLERERVEEEMRQYLNKDVHFFKDETLASFRHRIEQGLLSKHYEDEGTQQDECVGICNTMS